MRLTTFALCLVLVGSAAPVVAAPLELRLDLQEQGLALTGAATGGNFSHSPELTVTINGSVRFGLLYWSGANACPAPCGFSQPYADQQITFSGMAVTGTVIATHEAAETLHISYLADVTSAVSAAGAGTYSFSIGDGHPANNLDALDGFGLLVGYRDPNDTAMTRVQIRDGLEYLTAGDASSVTFSHGSAEVRRAGELFLMGGNGTASPSDYVGVSSGATVGNPFAGVAGPRYDLYRRQIDVPAGVGSTTATVGVDRCAAGAESIRWQVGALVTRNVAGSAAGEPTEGPTCASIPEPPSLSLFAAAAALGLARMRQRLGR